MLRLLRAAALPLLLVTVLAGCDAASPEAASADARYGDFCNEEFVIAGPGSLSPGQTATYTVTSESTCSIQDVDWNVGFNGSLVSSSGASAQIQAGTGSGPVWMEANVVYVSNQGYLAITETQRAVSVQ